MTTTTFTGAQSAQGLTITNNNTDILYFLQTSTAANAIVNNNTGGYTYFYDTTTAGTAQIDNNGGGTFFSNTSTADHAAFTNEADGFLDFHGTSTAANATITNGSDGTTYFEASASAGSATINNTAGATYFDDSSTASNAAITNTGTGFVDFRDTSTAGNATILNDASALPGGTTGSYTDFENDSTAGNSTITSINGGRVVFYDHSDGGNARLITQGSTSSVEFSLTTGHNGDHKVSAGSISGSGTYYLGSNALTVGSLGLDDSVSGVIRDGGRGAGTGAALVKVGGGTLTLSGSNAYSGGTTLVGGTLDLASATAAGSGALTFTSGAQSLALETTALGTDAQHRFANTIAGFGTDGDVIDLRGIGTATVSFNDLTNVLTLTAGGQTAATLTFSGSFAGQYFRAVSDGHGGTNVSVVSNAPPTINGASSVLSGTVSELPNVTGSSALDKAKGVIAFSDANVLDRPTASLTNQSVIYTDALGHTLALTAAQVATINAAFQIDAQAGNTNVGKVDWAFSLADKSLDFLGADEHISLTSTILVDDQHGGKVSQDVVLTLNGANDAPKALADIAGAKLSTVYKIDAAHGVFANDADPDQHDSLSVTAVNGLAANVGRAIKGSFGSLTLNSDGSYTYVETGKVFSPSGVAQDLFTYTESDGHGGTASTSLAITITSPGQVYVAGAPGSNITAGNRSTVLDGSLGGQTLRGGSAADVLIAGPGDVLTGGPGSDTFVFNAHAGRSTITDFNPAIDHLQIDRSVFPSLGAIFDFFHPVIQQVGSDLVLNNGKGDVAVLQNVSLLNFLLHPGDIIIA